MPRKSFSLVKLVQFTIYTAMSPLQPFDRAQKECVSVDNKPGETNLTVQNRLPIRNVYNQKRTKSTSKQTNVFVFSSSDDGIDLQRTIAFSVPSKQFQVPFIIRRS